MRPSRFLITFLDVVAQRPARVKFAEHHRLALAMAMVIAGSAVHAAESASTGDNCDRCGKVESVRQVSTKQTTKQASTPLGATAGGIVAGNPSENPAGNPTGVTMVQIGKGMTKKDTVVIGAAGGGTYRTQPPELNAKRWEVVVRMDSGEKRSLTQNYEPMLHEGDRVRVLGSQIERVQ